MPWVHAKLLMGTTPSLDGVADALLKPHFLAWLNAGRLFIRA
jgi:hypothetical protein